MLSSILHIILAVWKLKSLNNKKGLIDKQINFHNYELLKNKMIQKNSNSNNNNQDLVDLTEIKNL